MSNPLKAISPKIRFVIYMVFAIGSVVLSYLAAKEIVGAEEIAAWTALGALFGLTAGSNVDLSAPEVDEGYELEPERR